MTDVADTPTERRPVPVREVAQGEDVPVLTGLLEVTEADARLLTACTDLAAFAPEKMRAQHLAPRTKALAERIRAALRAGR